MQAPELPQPTAQQAEMRKRIAMQLMMQQQQRQRMMQPPSPASAPQLGMMPMPDIAAQQAQQAQLERQQELEELRRRQIGGV